MRSTLKVVFFVIIGFVRSFAPESAQASPGLTVRHLDPGTIIMPRPILKPIAVAECDMQA